MCPFDDDQSFDELRAKGRTLWHEHQRLLQEHQRLLALQGASCVDVTADAQSRLDEIASLRKQLDEVQTRLDTMIVGLKGRITELEAELKAKGGKGKGKNNRSERRKKPLCTKEKAHCKDPKCSTHNKPEPPEQTGHGPRPQATLPCDEKVHALPDNQQVCTVCGGQLKEMEGQVETSEVIDVQVRGYVRRKHIQLKYSCSCGQCIKTAPGPEKLIPGGRYSIGFGVEIAYDKYCDHMPLERQVRTMRHQGLEVDSQTLWDQLDYLAFLLLAPYRLVRQDIFSNDVIGADETTWWLMPRSGGSKTWQVWLCEVSDAVWYTLQPTRGADGAKKLFNIEHKDQSLEDALLPAYEGVVMVDGYAGYQSLAKVYPNLILAHCWSHVRREVIEAQTGFPAQSVELLDLIDELFAIDAEAPTGRAGDTERARLRATRSVKVIAKIEAWVWRYGQSTPPASSLSKAAGYIAHLWVGLTRFLTNPKIPLHNNGSERGARTPVVGRKNHYGSRSERGTVVAAIFYTLVETSRRSGMDPKTYMRLSALRNLRGQDPVLPKNVTEEMLVNELEMTAEQAQRAKRWRPEAETSTKLAAADVEELAREVSTPND